MNYIYLLVVLSLVGCQAANHEEPIWYTDMAKAQEIAQQEEKSILMFYTGSDWCMPCKALHQQVLEQQSFLDLAAEKFVLVELDFPSERVEQSEEQKKHNQFWFDKYTPSVYPTVFLCDAQAERFGEIEGYAEEKKQNYLKAIREILSHNQTANRLEKLLEQAQGTNKIPYLDSLLSLPSRYILSDQKEKIKTLLDLSAANSPIHSKYSRLLLGMELDEVLLPLIKGFGEVKYEKSTATASELLAISTTTLDGITDIENRFPTIPEGKALLELISLKVNAQFGKGETEQAQQSIQALLQHPTYSVSFKQTFANSFAALVAEQGDLATARSLYDEFIALDSKTAVAQQLRNGKVVFFKFLEGKAKGQGVK